MAIAYFDASALVKLLIQEDGTDIAVALWDNCEVACSSMLSYAEVRAALAAAHRHDRIDGRQLRNVEQQWDRFWAATHTVALSDPLVRRAGDLCRDQALRGADGIHVASALTLKISPAVDVIVVAWDARLSRAARNTGLRVAPQL